MNRRLKLAAVLLIPAILVATAACTATVRPSPGAAADPFMLEESSAPAASVPEASFAAPSISTPGAPSLSAGAPEASAAPQTAIAPEASAKPETSSKPETSAAPVVGVVSVGDGDMLERDIIPQLVRIYGITVARVKAALAACRPSPLIGSGLKDFRRMEGIVVPGRYEIRAGSRIEDQISQWIEAAETRFDRLLAAVGAAGPVNGLAPAQQLTLASIVEAECLSDRHEAEVATVFLNRLDEHGLLQSCVTVEYAVGYQRPYLLKTDLQAVNNYNTYRKAGLPPGPICSPDDASLRAAISRKLDSAIHYFYYDYLLNDLFCFVRYTDFSRAAANSKEQFIARSPIGRWTRINKQKLYGR